MTIDQQNLSAEEKKRQLLKMRLKKRQKTSTSNTNGVIPARPQSQNNCPASFAQQRMWLADQLDNDAEVSAYHISGAFELLGNLDIQGLQKSLDTLVIRHEILRTRFIRDEETGIRQVIATGVSFPLRQESVVPSEEENSDAFFCALVNKEIQQKFKLEQLPLARGTLYRINAQHHILVYTMHHIVGDAWSMGILFNEVASLYRSHVTHIAAELPELSIQYADYAIWQQQQRRLVPELLDRDLQYWQTQLQDVPSLLTLPCDFSRPVAQSFAGKRQNIELDRQFTASLEYFCQKHDVTIFTLLHAVWSLLLAKLSGQNTVVVGVPTSSRSHKELEPLIGFFINTLPVRIDIEPDDSVVDFMHKVKQQIIDGFSHQQAAFEDIVNHIQVDRSLGQNPIFQAMFVLRTTPHKIVELDGLSMQALDAEMDSEQFDLTLALTQVEGGITGYISYATDLFSQQTVKRWSGYFCHLLQQMVGNDNGKLQQLQLLDNEQRQVLLSQAMVTHQPTYQCNTVCQLFAASVQQYPEAAALEFAGHTLSYSQLNVQVNQLANFLLSQGCQKGTIVGICLPRSLDMYISVLAILKAGASYAPLVPNLPKARIAALSQKLANNGHMLMLTTSAMAEVFKTPVAPLFLDSKPVIDAIKAQPDEVSVLVAPEDPCYVLATSGSTGEPKLIDMSHKALVALIYGMQEHAPVLRESSRYLQFSSLGFDMSFTDMMLAWSRGGCLVAIEQDMQFDLHHLAQFIHGNDIEVMNLPAAVLQQLAEMAGRYPQLKCIISTAEALTITAPLKQFFKKHNHCQLLNHYGPSETHVVTAYRFPEVEDWLDCVPMGEPLGHVEALILDEQARLVPPGCVGELCISGVALANGYLYNSAQTAARFIEHPFACEGTSKLYRTGDLVRQYNDGRLEYIGRADQQVKIRGYRIEIGEIEACISRFHGVTRNLVVIHEPAQGNKQLVAYIQLDERSDQKAPSVKAIENHLRTQLPEYMVPKHIMVVTDWPLTTNGKIERKKLPLPQATDNQPTYCPVSSATEHQLLVIWSNCLAIKESLISADADFFALGGHSLLAVQMISRVNDRFDVSLTIRQAFVYPSIKAMSEYLDSVEEQQSLSKILPVSRKEAIPLSFAQKRLWFIDKMQGHSTNYHIFMALQIDGPFQVELAEVALRGVIHRHEILRTCYQEGRDGPVQVINDAKNWQLEHQDLKDLGQEQQKKARELMQDCAAKPFDLSQDYMIRALYLNLCTGQRKSYLLLTMHHIASDGWSMNILADEFASLYGYLTSDKVVQQASEIDPSSLTTVLKPLDIQYADFSVWQQQQFSAKNLEQQLNFWQQNLLDAPAVHSLPLDFKRPEAPGLSAQLYQQKLDLTVAHKLEAIAKRQGMTLFMLLHGVFVLLLSRHSGTSDIVLGTPVAGRNRQDLEGLIGFFVNSLILRVDVAKHSNILDYLGQIKEIHQQAQSNQDVPFERLVEHLNVPRALAYSPLFQIMFSYNTIEQADLNWPGVSASPMVINSAPAKFDLDVSLSWQEGGLLCNWLFDESLFGQASIAKYASHFIHLLSAMTEHFDGQQITGKLAALNMFNDEEERWLVSHSSPRHSSRQDCTSVPQRFAQQVAQSAEQIAIICDDQALTYQALNEQANQLAHYLIASGVQPGNIVGIANQRSASMIVQCLAVLKAGGSYLPLDPEYPALRFAHAVNKSKLSFVMTSNGVAATLCLPEHVSLLVTDTSEFASRLASYSVNDPQVHINTDSIAYVMFTSGSTGEPKGVRIPHGGILRLVCNADDFDLEGVSHILHNSNIAFDAATFEIWLALLNGRTCVVNSGLAYDYQHVNHLLTKYQVDFAFFTSGLFDVWSHCCDGLTSMKWIVIGGDVLPVSAVERLRQKLPEIRLVNGYGPTENTVFTSCKYIHPDTEPDGFNIGRAINETFTYVLAPDGSLSPAGARGELCVAGAGVAAGYLDLPQSTSEKFIHCDMLGKRLYKTGDMVRFSANGDILFAGRVDNQIKLRGFRIELSEIEAILSTLVQIDEVLVLLHQTDSAKHLVAFVTGCEPAQQAQVEQVIRDALPMHMHPELVQFMPEMPLTPNGKFDRSALLASLDLSEISRDGETVIDEAELALAHIWQKLLRVNEVYRHDNFFDIGGHSLLVVRLLVEIREGIGVELDVKQVFEQPTLSALNAVVVEKQQRENLATSIEAIAEEDLERFDF